MSSLITKGNANGTGSVTLESPNTNSDFTISLPAATGTTVLTDVAGTIALSATGSNIITASTNGSERMRIDSSGNLLVGNTTGYGLPARVNILTASGNPQIMGMRYANATAGQYWICAIDSSNGYYLYNHNNVGVTVANGGTSWSAVSDERLKTDLKPIENAIDKVSTIRALTGRYKTDEKGKSRSFLIAQDVQKVLPEAVSITKNMASSDETEYLALSYTETIPLLVKAIQELNAKVEAQAAEIAALKGAK